MKLLYGITSPYARKARVTAIEKGLADALEVVICNPFEQAEMLTPHNPLGKIPALILDNGEALYDSPVICEFLDHLRPEPRLIAEEGPARWRDLRNQALADGLLDAAYNATMEARRPDGERSAAAIAAWRETISRSLKVMEEEIGQMRSNIDLPKIAFGCALGYVDLRHGDLNWRESHPQLADWYKSFSARPSMQETAPE